MRPRKGKKIIIYIFLFLLVGSINNITLNGNRFDKIKNIYVFGLSENNTQILLKNLQNLDLKNIFFLNKKDIIEIANNNSLIQSYNVFKKYPSTIYVRVEKTKFLAKINKEGEIFLVGSNGKLSESNLSDKKLPFIFGRPDLKEFIKLKKIIEKSKISYDKIIKFYYFQSKRWDLELDKNILIKLPKDYEKNTLDNASEFLNNKSVKNVKLIDLRVENQIITND
tara:strand:+ start:1905 stop:2576 length:672 start_codon:yes stop_codon:yes gene_type:complete